MSMPSRARVRHRGEAAGQALAVPLGDGLQRRRHGRQPLGQVVGDGHVRQRHQQPGGRGEEQAADRELEVPALDLAGEHLGLVLDGPPGDPVRRGQTLGRHGPGPRREVGDGGQEPLLGGLAVVGEPVVVAGQAHEAGADRESFQNEIEELVGQVGDR